MVNQARETNEEKGNRTTYVVKLGREKSLDIPAIQERQSAIKEVKLTVPEEERKGEKSDSSQKRTAANQCVATDKNLRRKTAASFYSWTTETGRQGRRRAKWKKRAERQRKYAFLLISAEFILIPAARIPMNICMDCKFYFFNIKRLQFQFRKKEILHRLFRFTKLSALHLHIIFSQQRGCACSKQQIA